MNPAEKTLRIVDRFQQRQPWLAFPVAVWKKFGDDQAGNLAALIAYYAFVSIFPLFLILTTVLDIACATIPRSRPNWRRPRWPITRWSGTRSKATCTR